MAAVRAGERGRAANFELLCTVVSARDVQRRLGVLDGRTLRSGCQTRTLRSYPHDARYFPSQLHATASTASLLLSRVSRGRQAGKLGGCTREP